MLLTSLVRANTVLLYVESTYFREAVSITLLGNKEMRHKKTLLISLLLAPFLLYGLFLALVVHGDGYIRPSIKVNVVNTSGQPIADVAVVFLDNYCLRWCLNNEVAPDVIHATPIDSLPDMFRLRMSMAKTDVDGHAEVKGFFFSASYLWCKCVSTAGEVVLSHPVYQTLRVDFSDAHFRQSTRLRRQVGKGLVNLDLVMNEGAAPSQSAHGTR